MNEKPGRVQRCASKLDCSLPHHLNLVVHRHHLAASSILLSSDICVVKLPQQNQSNPQLPLVKVSALPVIALLRQLSSNICLYLIRPSIWSCNREQVIDLDNTVCIITGYKADAAAADGDAAAAGAAAAAACWIAACLGFQPLLVTNQSRVLIYLFIELYIELGPESIMCSEHETKKIGARAFSSVAPSIYNDIPLEIRQASSFLNASRRN